LGFSGVYRYGPQVSGTNAEIEGKKKKNAIGVFSSEMSKNCIVNVNVNTGSPM